MSEEQPQKPPKKKRNPFHRKPVPPLKKNVVSLPDVDVRQLPREQENETLLPDETLLPWAAAMSRGEQLTDELPRRMEAQVRRPRVSEERLRPLVGLLTVREVADLLGITPHALRERMRRRGVPVTKIGYMSLIARSDVERLK